MAVENLASLLKKLEAARKRIGDVTPVVVGYTANSAIHVHEDMEMPHRVGEAKFLETPLRQLPAELAKVMTAVVMKGGTVTQGLLVAGLRLQTESQLLVPVDTGALRASAFTREDK